MVSAATTAKSSAPRPQANGKLPSKGLKKRKDLAKSTADQPKKSAAAPAADRAKKSTLTPADRAKKSTPAPASRSPQREALVVTKRTGGRFSERPIEFTKDSRYLFACIGSSVKIISVATGSAVKLLSKAGAADAHTDRVTRVFLNPRNPMQLYSASLDGTIKLWDYNDDVLLKTIRVGKPVQDIAFGADDPDFVYIIADDRPNGQDQSSLLRFYLGSEDLPEKKRRRHIMDVQKYKDLDVSKDGQYVAVAADRSVYVWPVDGNEGDVPSDQIYKWNFSPVCKVRFNPTAATLAVGDIAGRIILNHYTPQTIQNPRTTIHHWHSSSVTALEFMQDGLYMISGGSESVLTFWQLATGHRQFMPRLGGDIMSISISPNHKYYCVGLSDNSIRLINAISQKIEQVIQGVQLDPAVRNGKSIVRTGLVVEPRNHYVVLNGVRSSVQFYNCMSDVHIADVEVSPAGSVSRTGEKRHLSAEVEHVAFLSSGEWMATVDMRDDQVTTMEQHLKFWQWDPNAQAYVLHTRVDKPHTAAITSLTFNPSTRNGPMAITTSKDKTFKVWHLTSQLGRAYQEGEVAWNCRSVGMYRRDTPQSAAFSADGSILAVAFRSIITIWDPYTNSIRQVLAQPSNEQITTLRFAGESPYLVAASANFFAVWNMLTCTVWWSYKLSASYIAVDKLSSKIAVACNQRLMDKSLIVTFDAKSAVPVAMHKMNEACIGLAFLFLSRDVAEGSKAHSDLVYLTCQSSFHVLSSKSTVPAKEAKQAPTPLAAAPEKKMLDDMFGTRKQLRQELHDEERSRAQTATKLRQQASTADSGRQQRGDEHGSGSSVLGAPSHVLPGVESVFESFMSAFMELHVSKDNDQAATAEHRANQMDVDEELPAESDVDAPSPASLGEIPSLSSYFTSILGAKDSNGAAGGSAATTQEASSSSSESDDSEDEDPADIEW